MMTGTMYLSAMRLASSAVQKQSPGVDGASTGIGASELRLNIALLGLRRQAGGRPTALNVADYEGQFGHYSEAQSFCLQRHAGARSRGDAQCAGIGAADGTGDGGKCGF